MMIQRHCASMLTIMIWRDALARVSLAQTDTSIGLSMTGARKGSAGPVGAGLAAATPNGDPTTPFAGIRGLT